MNPDEKEGNLANMIKNKSREKVIEEIKKWILNNRFFVKV